MNRNGGATVLAAAVVLMSVTFLASTLLKPGHEGTEKETGQTGVYLGIDPADKAYDPGMFRGCELVVIDAQQFSAEQIGEIKKNGVREIWSYIDVGSLETYRDYYSRFERDKLDSYEGWPDEFWADVSDVEWQKFVVDELASEIAEKGADGFFVDNADVYYHYPDDEIYGGLEKIFRGLKDYGLTVTVNGGDSFVSRLIDEGNTGIIDGVCQECVVTRIEDYEEDRFGLQNKEDREYFEEYLSECRSNGLDVMRIEYTRDSGLKEELESSARSRGERIYVSDSLKLD
ncbi:MAG: endo alpha-1,4 polygalactosaminidase [Clostridia bacterium]|nr:endo alpha-1,4 polygalactosaminidase [Clostridia bacterium]